MVIVPINATDPFASTTLMEQRSQGAITATSHPYLEQELKTATDDIRNFCRWHVSPVKQITHRHFSRDVSPVWLPAMQIASIDEVTVDGVLWDADQLATVDFDPDTGATNLRTRRAVVKFTAGYTEVPSVIQTVTLELAAIGLGTSLGFVRDQAGSVAVTFARAGGGIDAATEARLATYQIGRLP